MTRDGVQVLFRRGTQVKVVAAWCENLESRQCTYKRLMAGKATLAIRERGFREVSVRPVGGTIGPRIQLGVSLSA